MSDRKKIDAPPQPSTNRETSQQQQQKHVTVVVEKQRIVACKTLSECEKVAADNAVLLVAQEEESDPDPDHQQQTNACNNNNAIDNDLEAPVLGVGGNDDEELANSSGIMPIPTPALSRGSGANNRVTSEPGAFPHAFGRVYDPNHYSADFYDFGVNDNSCVAAPFDDDNANNNSNRGLARARLVVEDSQPLGQIAEEVEEEENLNSEKKTPHSTRMWLILGGISVILLVVIILAVTLALAKNNNSSQSSIRQNGADANDANPAGELIVGDIAASGMVLDLPINLPESTMATIRSDMNGTSPQHRAYQWMQQDPYLANYTHDQSRLVQRFVAATFYYATNGHYWDDRGGGNTSQAVEWLSYGTHECNWFNTAPGMDEPFCGTDGMFLHFEVSKNNLSGTIPEEIGLLRSVRVIKLGWSSLRGTLPTQLGLLTNLEELRVFRANVRGPIPSELTKLENLEVNRNDISGTIPSDVGYQVPLLRRFRFMENQLSGALPTSMGLCTDLDMIDLEGNKLTGFIPSELGQLVNITALELNSNNISGWVPSELGMLVALEEFTLEGNPRITGTFPQELAALNATLSLLNIGGTSISGLIPAELCGVEKLSFDCLGQLCGCECSC